MARKLPLVVVLGATACGKSKLAIEIARKFGGEIISADSMQVYRGLDIVTNKVTPDQQSQAKHHMIDFVDPLKRFNVVDFRNRSLDIIENLYKEGTLPIVVGGTNYYIESLLWSNFIQFSPEAANKRCAGCVNEDQHTLIDEELKALEKIPKDLLHNIDDLEDPEKFFSKTIYNDAFSDIDSEKLWNILEKVDPESAHYFHPADKRRIIRCLQVIQDKKQNYSDVLKSANISSQTGDASLGGSLRFESTCVIWLSCEQQLLDKVLDDRVDQMLDSGLLGELDKFHRLYNEHRGQSGEELDYQKGIFQTIGFKEFHPYLTLKSDAKLTEDGAKTLSDCISNMKLSTKQYARRQIKWIRRRLLSSDLRDLPHLFNLPTKFDDEEWDVNVREVAFRIVASFMGEGKLDADLLNLKMQPEPRVVTNKPAKHHCEACNRTFIGTHHIDAHLKSRSHARQVRCHKLKRMKMDPGEQTQLIT